METIANFPRILRLCTDVQRTKNIQLNRASDDNLVKLKVQLRSYNQTDCTVIVRQPIQSPVFVAAFCHPASV